MLRAAQQKMSAARCWWWLPALLWGGAGGYVVLSSVSWPLPEAGGAADELHSSSTEEALPGLLEEAGGIWKQSFPASAYREDAALGPGASARRSEQGAAPGCSRTAGSPQHRRAAPPPPAASPVTAPGASWPPVPPTERYRGEGMAGRCGGVPALTRFPACSLALRPTEVALNGSRTSPQRG